MAGYFGGLAEMFILSSYSVYASLYIDWLCGLGLLVFLLAVQATLSVRLLIANLSAWLWWICWMYRQAGYAEYVLWLDKLDGWLCCICYLDTGWLC
jgi:hypothetical protein